MTTATLQIPFVDLMRQHVAAALDIDGAIQRVRDRSSYILGEEVEAFEREFAGFCGTGHAVGVASGTDALFLTMRGYGIGPQDEVVTAVNTFVATAEAILMCGARPVFVDIDESTYLMDVSALEAAITPRTKAIVPVHLYGQPVQMRVVNTIARRHGLKVIEDACQAHGARLDGMAAGSLGDAGCFSFYPSKNLGAMGDGGIVVTDDGDLADTVRLLRNHGEDVDRLHTRPGFCSRLDGLQAAILRAKLGHLSDWNALRADAAAWYGETLAGGSSILPEKRADADHAYHLYVIRVGNRDEVRLSLGALGIGAGIHYALPLHLEASMASLGYRQGDFPVAERVASQVLSLPMYPYLERLEVEVIADGVEAYARNCDEC